MRHKSTDLDATNWNCEYLEMLDLTDNKIAGENFTLGSCGTSHTKAVKLTLWLPICKGRCAAQLAAETCRLTLHPRNAHARAGGHA